jgi:predicted Zn-dependent protease
LPFGNIGALALIFGRYKESAEAFEKAVGLDPNLTPALYGLASAYFHLADYERAFEVCRRLTQAHPEHSDAQQLLAAIEEKQGEVATTSYSHEGNVA